MTSESLSRRHLLQDPANHAQVIQNARSDSGGFITDGPGHSHLPSFSCPKLKFIFFLSFLIFLPVIQRRTARELPPRLARVNSRRASGDGAHEMKSTRLSGGVFPQCLFEGPRRSGPRTRSKRATRGEGRFISTQLTAASCSAKTTVPWPGGRHMERRRVQRKEKWVEERRGTESDASLCEIWKPRGYK